MTTVSETTREFGRRPNSGDGLTLVTVGPITWIVVKPDSPERWR
jgi:hypothetical protein